MELFATDFSCIYGGMCKCVRVGATNQQMKQNRVVFEF